MTRHSTGDATADKAASNSPEELIQRGNALAKAGQLALALECYRTCVRLDPQRLYAYIEMANTLVDLWSIDEALSAYGKALELAPESKPLFSALLFHTHYLPVVDQKWIFDLHRRFGEVICKSNETNHAPFALAPFAERRIRVGYVSPNFSRHSVGYFIEPVIKHHDRERHEIFCYYTHRLSDDTTERIRQLADGWRDVSDADDDAFEKMIRDDNIDILVDLAGHSTDNRIGVFARRPAPIQMTWLGYPDTTGLSAIDFRITDGAADPEPESDQSYTERLLRIDGLFLCYLPPPDAPPVSTHVRPASEVVFSSFNAIAKLNNLTIQAWSKILAGVPGSRILLKSASLDFPDTIDRLLECFESHGIAHERIDLRCWIANRREHLELYEKIDIGLDTFPYNGTTTTCEALWMGVPVISMTGSVHMSRVGTTILRSTGLNELIAKDVEDYIDIAIALARNQGRRLKLRAQLRDKLLSSPLLDHQGFTRKLEHRFRQSWTNWCDRQRAER